jgi:hypothetical protein
MLAESHNQLKALSVRANWGVVKLGIQWLNCSTTEDVGPKGQFRMLLLRRYLGGVGYLR